MQKNSSKRFEKNTGVLARAWLKGTLAHGSCRACAVGNMIAAGMGYRVEKTGSGPRYTFTWEGMPGEGPCSWREHEWISFFRTGPLSMQAIDRIDELYTAQADAGTEEGYRLIREEIKSTGYTARELAKVEHAFERTVHLAKKEGKTVSDAEFEGLMAVTEVLAGLDGLGLGDVKRAKQLFTNVQ